MINNLQRAIVLDRLSSNVEADDPDDAFLVAMAIAGDADYLVTGDRRAGLLQKGNLGRNANPYPCKFLCGSAVNIDCTEKSQRDFSIVGSGRDADQACARVGAVAETMIRAGLSTRTLQVAQGCCRHKGIAYRQASSGNHDETPHIRTPELGHA
jgi:uncharacterized protein